MKRQIGWLGAWMQRPEIATLAGMYSLSTPNRHKEAVRYIAMAKGNGGGR